MKLETISAARSFGGTQGVYRHASRETGTEIFRVYLPPRDAAPGLRALYFAS